MNAERETAGHRAEPLGLGTIITGSLPASLLTEDAPDHYTVEAVFTRKPRSDEVAELHAESTTDVLTRAGYPQTRLVVSDRRLEIRHTTLEELRDGLAATIAEHLAVISADVTTAHERDAARLHDASVAELARAARVNALAQAVSFVPESDHHAARHAESRVEAELDRQRESNWDDEGGAGRSR